MKKIILTRGYYSLIDDEDFEKINQFNWHVKLSIPEKPYARTCIDYRRVLLQNLILDCPDGMVIDHKNGNSLDNRRSNIRICTKLQNMANQFSWDRKSPKGVQLHHTGKYSARLYSDHRYYWVGLYLTEQEAADAYDKKAEELLGEYACLNRNRHLYVNPNTFYDKNIDPAFGFKKENFQKRLIKNNPLNLAYL